MRWRQGISAAIGLVFALGLIAGSTLWLYSGVRVEARWADFVEASAQRIVEASWVGYQAEQVSEAATSQQADPTLIATLDRQAEELRSARLRAETIAIYVVPAAEEGQDSAPEQSADLEHEDYIEILAEGVNRSDIIVPENIDEEFPYYREAMEDLNEKFFDLKDTLDDIGSEVDLVLSAAYTEWNTALAALESTVQDAVDVLESADPNVVGDATWASLWALVSEAESTLREVRGVDTGEAVALSDAAAAATEMTKRLETAFDPYFNPVEPEPEEEGDAEVPVIVVPQRPATGDFGPPEPPFSPPVSPPVLPPEPPTEPPVDPPVSPPVLPPEPPTEPPVDPPDPPVLPPEPPVDPEPPVPPVDPLEPPVPNPPVPELPVPVLGPWGGSTGGETETLATAMATAMATARMT